MSAQFAIESKTKLHLVNVNPRREKHGQDNVMAVDLKLQWETSNDALSMFDGWLKGSLYCNNTAQTKGKKGQSDLDGIPPVSDMPNLRFPFLAPLKLDLELTGYELRIDHGLGGKSDLVLDDCEVNDFRLDCKEGGTVVVQLRVQCNKISEREAGKLCTLIDSDIEATLLAPEVAEVE